MEWLVENWKYVTLVMAIASVAVNFTPNETDNKWYDTILKVLNAIAGNINVKGIGNK